LGKTHCFVAGFADLLKELTIVPAAASLERQLL
jgi:hypothetical protein